MIDNFIDQLFQDSAYMGKIRRAVEDAVQGQTAICADPSEMQREFRKLQKEVVELKDLADGTRPTGIFSIVVRVGLAVVAARGGVLTGALAFNDPIVKKALQVALEAFIGVVVASAVVGFVVG